VVVLNPHDLKLGVLTTTRLAPLESLRITSSDTFAQLLPYHWNPAEATVITIALQQKTLLLLTTARTCSDSGGLKMLMAVPGPRVADVRAHSSILSCRIGAADVCGPSHELGTALKARVRGRDRAVRALRRAVESDREHRGAGAHRTHSRAPAGTG
jgi:hypothetical protein